jgi:hypothetical protein
MSRPATEADRHLVLAHSRLRLVLLQAKMMSPGDLSRHGCPRSVCQAGADEATAQAPRIGNKIISHLKVRFHGKGAE